MAESSSDACGNKPRTRHFGGRVLTMYAVFIHRGQVSSNHVTRECHSESRDVVQYLSYDGQSCPSIFFTHVGQECPTYFIPTAIPQPHFRITRHRTKHSIGCFFRATGTVICIVCPASQVIDPEITQRPIGNGRRLTSVPHLRSQNDWKQVPCS